MQIGLWHNFIRQVQDPNSSDSYGEMHVNTYAHAHMPWHVLATIRLALSEFAATLVDPSSL